MPCHARTSGTTERRATPTRLGPQRRFRTAAMGRGLGRRGLSLVQELLSAEVPWDMVDSDAELKAVFRTLSLDR